MLYLSKLLTEKEPYRDSAARLLHALAKENIVPRFLDNTADIWLRDYMPVRTKSGRYISFRYAPSYLKSHPHLRTHYRDIADQLPIGAVFSDINLDGGNVVLSPSKERAIISDRVFSENPGRERAALLSALENLLEADVIIIESLPGDMTGHADGAVRFVDEHTVIGNRTPYQNGLEQRIKKQLRSHGLQCVDFPYYTTHGISAEGCYLNFLETESAVFLPVFGRKTDSIAIREAETLFTKKVIPVNISAVAKDGGGLNCITWET